MKVQENLLCVILLWCAVFVIESSGLDYGVRWQSCPCANVDLCKRITVPERQEVVAYAQDLDHYKLFDWTKLTTVVVYEKYLQKAGVEFVCFAHSQNTRILIAAAISRDELKNETLRRSVVKKNLMIADQFYLDGANIDVEIPTNTTELRKGLTVFVEEMKSTFSSAYPGSIVIADVYWLPYIYHDTRALAEACDFLFIMAYDEQADILPPCVAKANAPLYRTEAGVLGFLALGVPGKKLVLGTPWYGYFYNCTKLTESGMCYIKKVDQRCTQQAGVELDYRIITKRIPESMGGRKWSTTYQSPYITVKNNSTGVISQMWYDDPESLRLKYSLASKFGLRGVGMWHADALNYSVPGLKETKDMWDALPQYNHFEN